AVENRRAKSRDGRGVHDLVDDRRCGRVVRGRPRFQRGRLTKVSVAVEAESDAGAELCAAPRTEHLPPGGYCRSIRPEDSGGGPVYWPGPVFGFSGWVSAFRACRRGLPLRGEHRKPL